MTIVTVKDEMNLETLPGIKKIVFLENTASTQEAARELASHGDMAGTLIVSLEQSHGKGRLGHTWESAPGGIYMTLVLQPNIHLKFLEELSVMTGEVLAECLHNLYGFQTKVKLPNDVLVLNPKNNKFLKIAGILIESSSTENSPNWILLGIGVNLNNKVSLPTAVSASDILKEEVSREEFLRAFFDQFWRVYSSWEYSSESKSIND